MNFLPFGGIFANILDELWRLVDEMISLLLLECPFALAEPAIGVLN